MVETGYKLPATISAGLTLKIRDALRQTIDGHPASQGMPMESEVKHYYNYFLTKENMDFDTFVLVLAEELSHIIPGLEFNMAWVRQCDALNSVRTARRSVAKLRTYVHEHQQLSVSFWDILWKLQEVSFKAHGITPAEAGTTRQELRGLAWQFLLREGEERVQNLRENLRFPVSLSARQSFTIVDDMLSGIPIPKAILCSDRRAHYSASGPYETYRAFANNRHIPPEAVGWSRAEHRAARERLFPERQSNAKPPKNGAGPAAPSAIEASHALAALPEDSLVSSAMREKAETVSACPKGWSTIVALTMRNLPQLPERAIHPG